MEKVEAFKNELRNYRYYQKRLKELDDELMVNFYVKTGVSGIKYDKIPSIPSETAIANFRLSLIKEGDRIATERERVLGQMEYIVSTLKKMKMLLRKAIILIYVNGESYYKVAKECNYSKSGLFKAIEIEIERVL